MNNKKLFSFILIFILLVVSVYGAETVCGDGIVSSGEECDDGNLQSGDGCSVLCSVDLKEEVYIVNYIGDIDGEVSEEWYFFFNILADFFDSSKIKTSFSFYPHSLSDDAEFKKAFLKMYESEYIELIQKGFVGSENETFFDSLAYNKQYEIVLRARGEFITKMARYGYTEIAIPRVYNQYFGRFTEVTRKVLEDLEFIVYLEAFLPNDLNATNSSDILDITQYGVSIDSSAEPGPDSVFRKAGIIIDEINEFEVDSSNQELLEFNGKKVIPLWVHQQDFESLSEENVLNETKWETYTSIIKRLHNDPKAHFVTGSEIYALRHNLSAEDLVKTATIVLPPADNNQDDEDFDEDDDEKPSGNSGKNNAEVRDMSLNSEEVKRVVTESLISNSLVINERIESFKTVKDEKLFDRNFLLWIWAFFVVIVYILFLIVLISAGAKNGR